MKWCCWSVVGLAAIIISAWELKICSEVVWSIFWACHVCKFSTARCFLSWFLVKTMEMWRYPLGTGLSKAGHKNEDKVVKSVCYPKEASHKWTRILQTGCLWWQDTEKKLMVCKPLWRLFWGGGRHLSEHSCCRPLYQLCLGQVKIIPGKCSLRVTCPNLVSNTVIYKLWPTLLNKVNW